MMIPNSKTAVGVREHLVDGLTPSNFESTEGGAGMSMPGSTSEHQSAELASVIAGLYPPEAAVDETPRGRLASVEWSTAAVYQDMADLLASPIGEAEEGDLNDLAAQLVDLEACGQDAFAEVLSYQLGFPVAPAYLRPKRHSGRRAA